ARTTYRYDGVGQVKERTSLIADGTTPVTTRSTYVYDDLGRLTARTSAAAGTTRYRYDNQGNLKETEDALGNTTRYGYDVRGLLETVTQPAVGMQPSGVTRFTYNRNGTRTSVTNPLLGVTTFILDGHDRVKGSDDGVTGALERVTLDLAGRVTERKVYSKNAMGLPDKVFQWTENQYDPAGRLLKEIRKHFVVPDANPSPVTDIVTETRYDSAGRVTETIDPRGGTTTTQYDAAGRARLQRDAAGNEVVTAYDATGNRESVTVREATGPTTFQEYRTRYEYDDQNRIKKVLVDGDPNAPVTRETSYEYDQAGRKTREIDPDGGEKTWKYDLAGRRIEEKVQLTSGASPTYATTRWAYDTLGNLEKITDTNGNVTTYAYDVENRLVAETRGEPVRTGGPTWTYTYDAAGNRKTLTDPNGSSITFNYDAAGRYTGRTIVKAAGVKGPSSEAMTLDLLGRVTSWLSTGSGVDLQGTATHDSLDRILAETLQLGTGPVRTLERDYDPSGNVTSLKYPSGRVFNLGSDALDRLVTVKNAANQPIVSYEDVGGRQTRKIYGNGLVESRTYDAAPWLKTLSVARPSQTDLLAIDYRTRNLRGLKTEIVRSDRAEKDRYTYDAASRITREELALPEPPPAPPAVATPDVDTNYQLDGLLNITQRQRTQAGSTETTTSQGNTRNQYTQWAGQPLTYDPNGNLKTYQGQSFEYDADNRLARATTAAGETLELFYDPNGRKVREKKVLAGIPIETDYIQDGNQIVEAFPKDGLTPTLRLVHGRGIDEVAMAEIDPMATGSPLTVYPLQDEMGNVTHLTDASGGVVEKYRYEGYGKFRIFDAAGTSRSNSSYAWNRLFQGREHFGLVDAYDFRARSLWPDLGRFGQEDPLGYVDSLNLYQGVGGAWTLYSDPEGLCLGFFGGEPCSITANRFDRALEALKNRARFGASTTHGALVEAATDTLVDTIKLFVVDPLRAGEATGTAVGSDAGALETGLAVFQDVGRAAAIAGGAGSAAKVAGKYATLPAKGSIQAAKLKGRIGESLAAIERLLHGELVVGRQITLV
ncbi:MAG: hypothetical protein JNK60_15530, partial [Acidobacteria bacterium]|nr:hypothetical protein [Acidobacteriota bacterium]